LHVGTSDFQYVGSAVPGSVGIVSTCRNSLDPPGISNYRNVIDSGWIETTSVAAFVGQNEAGKSNLFEALHRLHPYDDADYDPDEDWPVDDWKGRKKTRKAMWSARRSTRSRKMKLLSCSSSLQFSLKARLKVGGIEPTTHWLTSSSFKSGFWCPLLPGTLVRFQLQRRSAIAGHARQAETPLAATMELPHPHKGAQRGMKLLVTKTWH
jgi:hypothetical protein